MNLANSKISTRTGKAPRGEDSDQTRPGPRILSRNERSDDHGALSIADRAMEVDVGPACYDCRARFQRNNVADTAAAYVDERYACAVSWILQHRSTCKSPECFGFVGKKPTARCHPTLASYSFYEAIQLGR